MATCKAGQTTQGHCCWVDGVVCPFFSVEEYICTLRAELGSWGAVHADPRYLAVVDPMMQREGNPPCGDYPGPGQTCAECGVTG